MYVPKSTWRNNQLMQRNAEKCQGKVYILELSKESNTLPCCSGLKKKKTYKRSLTVFQIIPTWYFELMPKEKKPFRIPVYGKEDRFLARHKLPGR